MRRRQVVFACLSSAVFALSLGASSVSADEIRGTIRSVDELNNRVVLRQNSTHRDVIVNISNNASIEDNEVHPLALAELREGTPVVVTNSILAAKLALSTSRSPSAGASGAPATPYRSMLGEFWYNLRHNLFKPLLLFFYLGFLVPILRVKFEFPYVIYQGLTIYLLIAIGWHGGKMLARLDPNVLGSVFGFMVVGFLTNFVIGILAYLLLRTTTRLRKVDQATVGGYYGSDSAGTFVTCLGVLASAHIAFGAYMPVMLAVMETPGCLVALYMVSRLRHQGMDSRGFMPDEEGYAHATPAVVDLASEARAERAAERGVESEAELSLEKMEHPDNGNGNGNGSKPEAPSIFSGKLLHEVFLNTGLYLLFGGIGIGFISGLQGPEVTRADYSFFVTLFQGILCQFLLEMGMTASRKLRDLKSTGIGYVLFGLLAPNLFAIIGIVVAHAYSVLTGTSFELGTYVFFAGLCAAASYIAVPEVQRLAIPEASPTLPLAASLGLTFSYNVTIGIPVCIEIAKLVSKSF
jgi:uncharacterized protein